MLALSLRAAGWWHCVWALGALAGCGEGSAPDDDLAAVRGPEVVRIASAREALVGAHIPTLDPATMNDAEIERALGAGPHCQFRYTKAGRPVLAWTATQGEVAKGVTKLNGHLVILRSSSAAGAIELVADDVRLSVSRDQRDRSEELIESQGEANATFEAGSQLKVGYRGYYKCAQ